MNLESHEIVITVEAEEIHSCHNVPHVGIPRLCQSEACCSDTWYGVAVSSGHFVSLYRNEASQLRVRIHDFGCGDALVVPCRLGTHNYGDIIVRLLMTGCHYWQSTASVRIFGMYTNPSDLVQE